MFDKIKYYGQSDIIPGVDIRKDGDSISLKFNLADHRKLYDISSLISNAERYFPEEGGELATNLKLARAQYDQVASARLK